LTFKLILENLRYRPLRTMLSVLLIAIPVTLILTLVGLSQGMREESARRTRGIGADILIKPPNTSVMSFSAANIPQNLVKWAQQQPHVTVAVGAAVALVSGITTVNGVDLEAFSKLSGGFRFIEDGPFKQPDDILIDDYYAKQKKVHAGDYIDVLNKKWRVAGIFESGKLRKGEPDLLETGRSRQHRRGDCFAEETAPGLSDLFHAGYPHADLG
jgi:putative ABC transport system permease protein